MGPTCTTCEDPLVLGINWSERRKDGHSLTCRKCEAVRARKYVTRRRERRRKWMNLIKTRAGCAHCGYNEHPVALHFDHIDPDDKLFGIGSGVGTTLKRLMTEVRKCRVLCANCHSVHTHKEKHNARNKKYD